MRAELEFRGPLLGRSAGAVALAVSLLVGAGACVAPLPTLVLVALAVAGYLAVVHTAGFISACVLLTVAFPKAGVKVGGFPFPVFLFVLVLAALLIQVRATKKIKRGTALPIVLLLAAGFLLLRSTVAYDAGGLASAAPLVAWTAGPVLVLLLVSANDGAPRSLYRSAQAGFMLTVVYGLLQVQAGIEAVAVPGLTYAFGDDLTGKNNGLGGLGVADLSKIPSTYQNGNVYGIAAAVFGLLALQRLLARASKLPELVVGSAAVAAILLSGSRTAIVASLIGATYLFLTSGRFSRKAQSIVLFGAVVSLVIALRPALLLRYSISAARETGGSGRLDQWAETLRASSPYDLLLGSSGIPDAEGWAGIVSQIGIVGVVLIATVVALSVPKSHRPTAVALAIAAAAFIDTTYYVFPTLYLPALMTCLVWKPSAEASANVESSNAGSRQPTEALVVSGRA